MTSRNQDEEEDSFNASSKITRFNSNKRISSNSYGSFRRKTLFEIRDENSTNSKKPRLDKNDPIEETLSLTLEEIFNGTRKNAKVKRNVLDPESGSVKQEEKTFNIRVKPGMTRVTFPEEGNQSADRSAGDVVFVVKDLPHSKFKLINGVNLVYTAKITPEESENGCELTIPTLENDPIMLTIEEEITEDMEEQISGRGLMHADNAKKRGCLIVKFKVCDNKNEINIEESNMPKNEPEKSQQVNEGLRNRNENKIDPILKTTEVVKKEVPKPKKNESQEPPKQVKKDHEQSKVPIKTSKEQIKTSPEPKIPQDPPVESDLMLSLEQILKGCTKRLKINRMVVEQDGSETFEDKIIEIVIKPGTEEGARFTFPKEGDQNPGTIPADVVFIVRDKPHDTFKRYGTNVEYRATITQKQFLNGNKIKIPTLENDEILFSLEELSKPSAVKRFHGRGLPFPNDQNKRGELVVRFDVDKNADDDDDDDDDSEEEQIENKIKDPPVENNLMLSLEQVLNGCIRKLKIHKIIVDKNGKEKDEDKILEIKVDPGTKAGTRFPFEREGDQRPGAIPADLIFIAQDKPHDVFKRIGQDIEYIAQITDKDVRKGNKIQIQTLEKDNMTVTLDGSISMNTTRQIANRGLPYPNEPTKRGSIIVRFDVAIDSSDEIKPTANQQLETKETKRNQQLSHGISKEPSNIPKGRAVWTKENHVVQLQVDKQISQSQHIQDPLVEFDLPLTLKDIFYGAIIDYRHKVKVTQLDGKHKFHENILSIEIKPGTLLNTRLTFKQAGNQYPGKIPADVVFVTSDVPHPYFTRHCHDVFYTALITQGEAESGVQLEIPTLELNYKTVKINFRGTIKNGKTKKLKGYGLPKFDNPRERGNLVVKIEIVDEQLKDETIEEIVELSLEDIKTGIRKDIIYHHLYFDLEGNEQSEERIIILDIKPGTAAGTRFYYPRYGNACSGRIPADFEFFIGEKTHPYFTRNGINIEYISKLTQIELNDGRVQIPLLDGSEKVLTLTKDIMKKLIYPIRDHGLPVVDDPKLRGDLVVKFEIIDQDNRKTNSLKKQQTQNYQQTEQQIYNLRLTLEEIVCGCLKYIQVFNEKQNQITNQKINIKPGSVPGKNYMYRIKNCQPFEINIEELPHDKFVRKGWDIHHTISIHLKASICGTELRFEAFDKKLKIPLTKVVEPFEKKIIENRGIPLLENPLKRGDFVILYNVDFPLKISKKDKNILSNIFDGVFEKYPRTRDKIVQFDLKNNQKGGLIQSEQNDCIDYNDSASSIQNPPIEYTLELSLEEIACGYTGKCQIARTVIDSSGKPKRESKILKVKLKPGQSKAIFPREGNQSQGRIPSDVIFYVKHRPHHIFKRLNEVNIGCTAMITLQEALCGFWLQVTTLENKTFDIPFGIDDETLIRPNFKYTFPHHGLPYSDDSGKKGNLIILFDIIFPRDLPKKLKDKLSKIL